VSESWRPRPDDHLVEPFFGGLGHEAPPAAPRRRAGWSGPRLVLLAVLVPLLVLALALLALIG